MNIIQGGAQVAEVRLAVIMTAHKRAKNLSAWRLSWEANCRWSTYKILCFADREPCTISQIFQTRAQFYLNIFICLLYMFRASKCPSSGENHCISATLVFVTLYVWRLFGWLDCICSCSQAVSKPVWHIPFSASRLPAGNIVGALYHKL